VDDPRAGWRSRRREGVSRDYTTDEQRQIAEATIPDVDASGHWPGKVVTKISKAGPFWEAVPEDQDALQRYPDACPFPRAEARAASRETAA
jgi:peptide-methionine (S)-S-oxide reductase